MSRSENEKLKLIIEDNGPGISGAMDQIFRNGVGLSNTAERLEKLYGDDHQLQFNNRINGGLQVVIEIPFRKFDQ